jgi:elongation factor P
MGRGGAVLKIRLKNVINGKVLDKTMQGNETIEEGETEIKKANYMYADGDTAHLMDNESFDQFEIDLDILGEGKKFLKEGTDVNVLYFEGKPVSIKLPVKLDFKVISSPPGVKGNSAGNVTKQVKIETGAYVTVPMFIKEGDIIRINTEKCEYAERVNNN